MGDDVGGERDDCSASASRTYPPTATMTVAFTGFVDSTVPLRLLLPNATIANGEVSCDLTSFAGGAGLFTTLHATGAVTMDTSATVGTTLAVAGTSTLHAVNMTGALAVTGAATVSTTLGVTGATTLAAASSTALTASTSLTVTGANIVGLTESVSFSATNIRAASAGVFGVASPYAGTIVKVYTFLNNALATGDAVLTTNINGVGVTNGVVTITQAGSAVGDVDVATPTALNTVAVGDSISVAVSGANDANPSSALVTVVIRRSA